MNFDNFFCHLTSTRIKQIIEGARSIICYAAPGIQMRPAEAMVEVAKRLGPEMVTVWLDFDERVFRMGYGHIDAVKLLRSAGIVVSHAPKLRSAILVVDREGYSFTPTPLYLEAEPDNDVRNAVRLSAEQVTEAMARLSPAAKIIAAALSPDPEGKIRISNLPPEGDSKPVSDSEFERVASGLKEAPPVKFDLARQVRVFEPYLQYVELSLSGAAIQRHRLTIPAAIQNLGGSKDLEGRLRTTFDLIQKGGSLSSKPLEDALNEIRKNFTHPLGKDHGRVILKATKPYLEKKLEEFRKSLKAHQDKLEAELKSYIENSRKEIIDHFLPTVKSSPPDFLVGRALNGEPSEKQARRWLESELGKVFPEAEDLIQKMTLEVRYKDVTFETLNRNDFLESVKKALPDIDWEKAYKEFKAAGEIQGKEAP